MTWLLTLATTVALIVGALDLGSLVLGALAPGGSRAAGRPAPQVRSFTLYVREGWVPLADGQQLYVWGFTDDPTGPPRVPGPTLAVDEGDTVEVTLINDRDPTASDRLPVGEGHTIHLHGLDVPTEHDGVPETHAAGLVRQGGRYTYRFVAQHAGTYFYHCHQNNVEHQQMGMYGAIVVRAAGGANTAYSGGPAFDREHTLVLADAGRAGHEQARHAAKEGADPYNWLRYTPDYVFANDHAVPTHEEAWDRVAARPGERVLVRAINAGYVLHALHAHDQPFQIVASDGRPWPGGPTTDTVWLGPGERYDLLVTADAAGRVALHDHADAPYTPTRPPPPGAAPAASGAIRRYTLYLREGLQVMPDGVELYVQGFTADPAGAAQVPGPGLLATEGDQIEVTLIDDQRLAPHGVALQVPGLGVPLAGPDADGASDGIGYRFLAPRAGSYLYGGATDGARPLGQYGALIVEPAAGSQQVYAGGPTYDRQQTLILSEMDAAGHLRTRDAREAGAALYDWARFAPNYFLINGRAYPDTESDPASMVHANPGERVLLRTINAGQQPHAMHLHGYHFQAVAVDGRPLPTWPAKDTVLIGPGESFDLLFVADQPGRFPFHDHFETANTNDGVWLGGMHTMVATGAGHAHPAAAGPLPGGTRPLGAPGAAARGPVAASGPTAANADAAAPPAGVGATSALAAAMGRLSAPAPAATDAAAPTGPSVFVRDNFYTPNQLTVPVGSTVRWEHQGQAEHTVSHLLGLFDSGTLQNGETFSYTFTAPGRYDYFCRFHITNRGRITVQ